MYYYLGKCSNSPTANTYILVLKDPIDIVESVLGSLSKKTDKQLSMYTILPKGSHLFNLNTGNDWIVRPQDFDKKFYFYDWEKSPPDTIRKYSCMNDVLDNIFDEYDDDIAVSSVCCLSNIVDRVNQLDDNCGEPKPKKKKKNNPLFPGLKIPEFNIKEENVYGTKKHFEPFDY